MEETATDTVGIGGVARDMKGLGTRVARVCYLAEAYGDRRTHSRRDGGAQRALLHLAEAIEQPSQFSGLFTLQGAFMDAEVVVFGNPTELLGHFLPWARKP